MITDSWDNVKTGRRLFLKQSEFKAKDMYFVGMELVQKVSQKTGNPYDAYFVYFHDGEDVVTLELMTKGMSALKDLSPARGRKMHVSVVEDGAYKAWNFALQDGFMDPIPDLPSYPSYQPRLQPREEKEEVNIDDIPF